MLKRWLLQYREFMQADTIATMRALHDDVFKQLNMMYNQQIKSNEIISKELGAAAKSIEAALLTLALDGDERNISPAEEHAPRKL